jgi:hypothetical protein
MGTRSAHGSITISDAYTFGVDDAALLKQVRDWAKANEVELATMAPRFVLDKSQSTSGNPVYVKRYNYLRVVSRVYLTGSVNVALNNDEASGGFLSARPPAPLELLNLGSSASNYQNTLDTLNTTIGKATTQPTTQPTVGGSIKIATASSRSITLNETFPRPLVVGYLGFDLPIGDKGELGALLPTQSRLNGFDVQPIVNARDANSPTIENWLGTDPSSTLSVAERAQRKDQILAYLKAHSVDSAISDILNSASFAALRASIVHDLIQP